MLSQAGRFDGVSVFGVSVIASGPGYILDTVSTLVRCAVLHGLGCFIFCSAKVPVPCRDGCISYQ